MRLLAALFLALLSASGCSEAEARKMAVRGTGTVSATAGGGGASVTLVQNKCNSWDNLAALPNTAGDGQLTGVASGNTLVHVTVSTINANSGTGPWPTPTDAPSGDAWAVVDAAASVGNSPSDGVIAGMWWRQAASSGTHTLTQSFALGANAYGGYCLLELTPASAIDTHNHGSGITGVIGGNAGSLTATVSGFLLAGLGTNTNGAGLANSAFALTTPAAGMTSDLTVNDTTLHAGTQISHGAVSASTFTPTWSWSSGAQTTWFAVAATFKP